MATAYIIRRALFSAAHRLHSDELSAEQNSSLYGKCDNPYGHGHNYTLEVTVRGKIDPTTGMVMNLTDLKAVIEEQLLQYMDHRNLNLEVPFLQGIVPTAENLAVACWQQLQAAMPEGTLYEVKIHETENNSAVYRGELRSESANPTPSREGGGDKDRRLSPLSPPGERVRVRANGRIALAQKGKYA
jgi:6-pyruvoyltetrahydropterin/6-carboxytetrahydropterin synthase